MKTHLLKIIFVSQNPAQQDRIFEILKPIHFSQFASLEWWQQLFSEHPPLSLNAPKRQLEEI